MAEFARRETLRLMRYYQIDNGDELYGALLNATGFSDETSDVITYPSLVESILAEMEGLAMAMRHEPRPSQEWAVRECKAILCRRVTKALQQPEKAGDEFCAHGINKQFHCSDCAGTQAPV